MVVKEDSLNEESLFHAVLGLCQSCKAHLGIQFFMCSYIFELIHCSVTKLQLKLGKPISYMLYFQASQCVV